MPKLVSLFTPFHYFTPHLLVPCQVVPLLGVSEHHAEQGQGLTQGVKSGAAQIIWEHSLRLLSDGLGYGNGCEKWKTWKYFAPK